MYLVSIAIWKMNYLLIYYILGQFMGRVLLIVLILVTALGLFAYSSYQSIIGEKNSGIMSPLPEFLTNTFTQVLGASNYFRPNKEPPREANIHQPKTTAESALSYDLVENRALYAKNPDKRLPIASLTKIMTAALTLENYKTDHRFQVTKGAVEVGENSMGLEEGEVLTLENLLYGMMLPSGNDAAETITQGSNFGRDNFVYLMNRKSEELGLTNTHFTNATGLEGDGPQYSTAYDLLVMTRYALENPLFAQVVSTYEYDIPASGSHKAYHLYNETNLLTSYPGVKGVKTGYTFEAGLCLVTYLEYDGHKIIAVILNAQNRRQEMKDLLDYSLKTLGIDPPPHD